jgi:hypothetical protein
MVQGAGFRVHGSGCRVQGAWFRVQGSGCLAGRVSMMSDLTPGRASNVDPHKMSFKIQNK